MDPIQKVTDAAGNAMTGGIGNFFGNLVGAPFKAVSGFVSGALGSLWNGAMFTAGITALKLFTPDLWRLALTTVGGKDSAAKAAARVSDSGITGVIFDSALEGFGASAALGGIGGAVEASAGGSSGLGGLIGTGVVLAGVTAVTIGAIHHNGIKVAENGASPTPPPTIPGAKPKAEQAKA